MQSLLPGDAGILAKRHELYLRARTRHPARWSGATRNWSPVGAVTLNPEKESVIKMAEMTHDLKQVAA